MGHQGFCVSMGFYDWEIRDFLVLQDSVIGRSEILSFHGFRDWEIWDSVVPWDSMIGRFGILKFCASMGFRDWEIWDSVLP